MAQGEPIGTAPQRWSGGKVQDAVGGEGPFKVQRSETVPRGGHVDVKVGRKTLARIAIS